MTAGPEAPATFHQRRDPSHPGVEETIDAVADRIEYDNRADTVKLFTHAIVRRFENGVLRDEFTGDQITYDARNSHYELAGTGTGSGGRVTARIAPRISESASGEEPRQPAAAGRDGSK